MLLNYCPGRVVFFLFGPNRVDKTVETPLHHTFSLITREHKIEGKKALPIWVACVFMNIMENI